MISSNAAERIFATDETTIGSRLNIDLRMCTGSAMIPAMRLWKAGGADIMQKIFATTNQYRRGCASDHGSLMCLIENGN